MKRSPAIAAAAILLFGFSDGLAQTGNSGSSPPTSATTQQAAPAVAGQKFAPHQQPKAADVPTASADQSPEDRDLDRKLKGICRGC